MALDDYLESEVGIAIAATAVALSPPVRRVARQGAVYGLAGLLMVSDRLGSLVRGARQAVASPVPAAQAAPDSAAAAADHLADLVEEAAPPAVMGEGTAETGAAVTRKARRARETAPAE